MIKDNALFKTENEELQLLCHNKGLDGDSGYVYITLKELRRHMIKNAYFTDLCDDGKDVWSFKINFGIDIINPEKGTLLKVDNIVAVRATINNVAYAKLTIGKHTEFKNNLENHTEVVFSDYVIHNDDIGNLDIKVEVGMFVNLPLASHVVQVLVEGSGSKPNGPYYLNNEKLVLQITSIDPRFNQEVANFKNVYNANKSVYEDISKKAGVPPELVAILHYRENTTDFLNATFGIYLHNGQTLGKPTTIVPVGKNFNNFNDAAVDAFNDKSQIVSVLQLSSASKDTLAILTFAEVFNGTGYADNGYVSPYLYSGTNIYTKGKYPSDGIYDPNLVDAQAGAYILLDAIK